MILILIVHLREKRCVKCSYIISWKCLMSICPIAGDKFLTFNETTVCQVKLPLFINRIVLSPSWLHQWLPIDFSHFHRRGMFQILSSQRLRWTHVSLTSDRQLSRVLQEPCRLKLRIMAETERSKHFNPERSSCRILMIWIRRSCWNQAVPCSKFFYIVQNSHFFFFRLCLSCRLHLTRNIYLHFEWKCKSRMTLHPSVHATNTICTTYEIQTNK